MSILNNGRKPRKLSLLGVGFSSADDSPESNRVLAYLEGRRISPSPAGAARKSVIALALLFVGGIYLWQSRNSPQTPLQMPVAVKTSAATQIAQNNSAPAEPARIVDDSSNAAATLFAAKPAIQTRADIAGAAAANTAPAANARRRTAQAIALRAANPTQQIDRLALEARHAVDSAMSTPRQDNDVSRLARKTRADSSDQAKSMLAPATADETALLQLSSVSHASSQLPLARDVPTDPDAELLATLLQLDVPLPDSSHK